MDKGTMKWKVLFGGFVSYMFDSLDLALLAMALPMIIKDFSLSMQQAGLLGTATLIGVGVSSIIAGWFADNYGRKKSLFWSLVSFGILTAAIAFARSWEQVLVLRFLAGVGLGGVWGIIAAYVNETWPIKWRGRAVAFVLSAFPVGAGFASFLAGIILPKYGWRTLFLCGAGAILIAVYMYIFVPESKEWEEEKAAGIKNGVNKTTVSIKEIFSKEYRKNVVFATLTSAFAFSAYWGTSTWLPTFLVKERGISTTTMATFIVVLYIGMFVGQNVFGYLSDRIGKKNALILTFTGTVIILPIYASTVNKTALLLLGPMYGFFISYSNIFGSYFADLFPTRIRTMGAGFCFNIGRAVSAFAPLWLSSIAVRYSLATGIGLCAGVFFLSVVTMLFLPDTRKADNNKITTVGMD